MVETEHHRALGPAERLGESNFYGTDYAESQFRDERSLADDLARLEAHYRSEAREALDAARACREWRENLRQQRTSEAP